MAGDEVFTVSFKIDAGSVDGDAEAAGKAAAAAFQKGFGSIEIKPKIGAPDDAGKKAGSAFQQAESAASPLTIGGLLPETLRRGGDGGDGGVGGVGGAGGDGGDGVVHLPKPKPEGKPEGAEVATKALGALTAGIEGFVGLLAGGGLATGLQRFGAFTKEATETAKAGGLVGKSFEKAIPLITATGTALATGAVAGYEMTKSGQELRLEMEGLAKSVGEPTEQFVKFRELMAGGGFDIDEFARGTANLAVRMQQARSTIERQVAAEPLEAADAADAATKARINKSVVNATASERDAIAAKQGPLNIVTAALGLDEATQTQQEHEDEAPHRIIAARARAAVEAATGGARDEIETSRADLGVQAAKIGVQAAEAAQQQNAEHRPLTIAGAQQRIAATQAEAEIGAIQGPLTVEGAGITAEGADIQAARAELRYRQQVYGERPDPERVQQLNREAAGQALDAAEFTAKQAHANVEKAGISEDEQRGNSAQAMAEAVQGLKDAIRQTQLEPQQDANRVAGAKLQERAAETDREALQIGRDAGEGHADRLSTALENLNHTQEQILLQAKRDAAGKTGAEIGVETADAAEKARLASKAGGGGQQTGELTPEAQKAAADRQAQEAKLDEEAKQQQQVGPLAQTILTGKGPALEKSNESLLLPALVHAGEQRGGGFNGAIEALAGFVQRDPENPGVMAMLKAVYPGRATDPAQLLLLRNKLQELGPQGIENAMAEPASEDAKLLSSQPLLDKAIAGQKNALRLKAAGEANQVKAADTFSRPVNAATGAAADVVSKVGPAGEIAGGAVLTGAVLYGAAKVIGSSIAGAVTEALVGAGIGGGAAAGGAAVGAAAAPAGAAVVGGAAGALGGAEAGAGLGTFGGPVGIGLGAVAGAGLGALLAYYFGGGAQPKPEEPAAGAPPPAAQPTGQLTQQPAEKPAEQPAEKPAGAIDIYQGGGEPSHVPIDAKGNVLPPAPAPATTPAAPAPQAGGESGLSGAAGALQGAAGQLSGAAGALSNAAGALSSAKGSPGPAGPPGAAGGPGAAGASGGEGGGGGSGEAAPVQQAGGGHIQGAGTETSDSIPAYLSHGEYIVKASSVRQYGVPFLDRLNSGGFAFGGLVKAYAGGGDVNADDATWQDSHEALTRQSAKLAGMKSPEDTSAKVINMAEKPPDPPQIRSNPTDDGVPPGGLRGDQGVPPGGNRGDQGVPPQGLAAGGLVKGYAEGGEAGDDDDRQVAIHRAQLFSVPLSVITALGRGTMEDVRLLNQGLELVGKGMISGAELAGRVVKSGWQDWLKQTMKEAPHQFSLPKPTTLHGKPAKLATRNGVTGVMDNGFLVAPDNPRDKIEDHVEKGVVDNLAGSYAARLKTSQEAGGFAPQGEGFGPKLEPRNLTVAGAVRGGDQMGPEGVTHDKPPPPQPTPPHDEAPPLHDKPKMTKVQVYHGGDQTPKTYEVPVDQGEADADTHERPGLRHRAEEARKEDPRDFLHPDKPSSVGSRFSKYTGRFSAPLDSTDPPGYRGPVHTAPHPSNEDGPRIFIPEQKTPEERLVDAAGGKPLAPIPGQPDMYGLKPGHHWTGSYNIEDQEGYAAQHWSNEPPPQRWIPIQEPNAPHDKAQKTHDGLSEHEKAVGTHVVPPITGPDGKEYTYYRGIEEGKATWDGPGTLNWAKRAPGSQIASTDQATITLDGDGRKPRSEPLADELGGHSDRPGAHVSRQQEAQATGQDRAPAPRPQAHQRRRVRDDSDYHAYSNPDQLYSVGGLVRGFAEGGLADGGHVPAMVSNGEYRMSAAAVGRYGSDFMDKLNGGGLIPGFATGGVVNWSPAQLGGATTQAQTASAVGAAEVLGGAGSAAEFSHGGQGLQEAFPVFNPLFGNTPDYVAPDASPRGQGRPLAAFGGAEATFGAFASAYNSMGGYGAGMATSPVPTVAAGNTTAQHTLNLATSGGTFQLNADADTIEAIRTSAIGTKLTSTGTRPSWY